MYFKFNICVKVKVKKAEFTIEQAMKAQWGKEVNLYSFYNLCARWDGWSTPSPDHFTPGKTRYPLYRRLGETQSRTGQERKISPQPGFDPRTVQPVASRYTD
jgi:hypothetical protein